MPRMSKDFLDDSSQSLSLNEVRDVKHAFDPYDRNRQNCMGDNCSNLAVACWFSNLTPQESWYCCEKCQEKDFDGQSTDSVFEDEDDGPAFEY